MKRRLGLAVCALLLLVSAGGWQKDATQQVAGSMTEAAQKFLASLSDAERKQATMSFDDPARTDWHYIPKATRKGLQFKNMNADQRKAAMSLMQTGLSEMGFDKATTIMSLEEILRVQEQKKVGGNIRDTERYFFTVFGTPTASGKWGWSVEGHHLSLNFTVNEGKVASVTPSFFGANPAVNHYDIDGAPKKGERVLVKEETLAFDLLGSLNADQKKLAVVADKAPADVAGASEAQAKVSAPAGLAAAKMKPEQAKLLMELIETYIKKMPESVAAPRLAEIQKAGVDQIHFAWSGADKPGIGHFYKVQGPTFILEFVNVQPDANGLVANHIHSLWRSIGEDFGAK